jgi:hypothetical protein
LLLLSLSSLTPRIRVPNVLDYGRDYVEPLGLLRGGTGANHCGADAGWSVALYSPDGQICEPRVYVGGQPHRLVADLFRSRKGAELHPCPDGDITNAARDPKDFALTKHSDRRRRLGFICLVGHRRLSVKNLNAGL